jgi:tetratricopeptide (TPR) repeat protein
MKCLLVVLLSAAACAAQEAAPDLPSLLGAGNTSYLKGDYEAARQSFAQAWELAQQTPADDPVRYDVLKRLSAVRAAAGEFADADNYLQMAINWQEHSVSSSDPKVAADLIVSFNLCRAMKNFDRAEVVLGRARSIHVAAYGFESTQVADDYSRLAQMELDRKGLEAAVKDSQTALQIREKLAGPLALSLLPDLDRVAATNNALREYQLAEAFYRRALVIRETNEGREDPDLIATVDGLAYAYFGEKKYEEAEPVYKRLLGLWVKSVGGDHPMVAMALDKVAVFYADQRKYDESKAAMEQANAIRTHFLALGLSSAAAEQLAEGNKADALALYRRALKVMDPPDPLCEDLSLAAAKAVKNLQPRPRKK